MFVGDKAPGKAIVSDARENVRPKKLLAEFDAVVLAGGAEQPRDLPIPGRELDGVHFAMEFLPLQNRRVAGDAGVPELWATGKHVVIIGGGDTGSDCVGTSNRHGAKSVTQFELLPMPPDVERNPVWPYWPTRLRTSSSHEEGVSRDWSIATKAFIGENGEVKALKAVRLEWKDGKPQRGRRARSSMMPADLVLLAMGFVSPLQSLLDEFGVERDARGNAKAPTDGRRLLRHLGAEGVRRRRHAPRPVAGRLGDPRGPPVRPRGGRIPHGVFRASALSASVANEASQCSPT